MSSHPREIFGYMSDEKVNIHQKKQTWKDNFNVRNETKYIFIVGDETKGTFIANNETKGTFIAGDESNDTFITKKWDVNVTWMR